MERLGGMDSTFLYFETAAMHMHVLGLMVIDPSTMPGGYSFDKVRAHIENRAPLIPGMRRRLATVPFNLSHPYWVEDSDFDLDYHLRRVAVPSPGGDHELAEVVADIAGRALDRSKPLWETWVLEGLADGQVAIVTKMHHCTVDGVTGANMMFHLFDLEQTPSSSAALPDAWEPERRPSDLALVGRAVQDLVGRPVGIARLVPGTIFRFGKLLAARRGRVGQGMPAPFTAPRTSFNATITAHRRVGFTSVPLAEVKAVKDAFGVKLNDVVIAICAGALRHYLTDRDELPDKPLSAAVPISVHDSDPDSGAVTNRVSVMFNTLATDVADPAERLRTIAAANAEAKVEHDLVGAKTLQQWASHAAPNTFSLAARVYSGLRFADHHPVVHNLIVSNVPGPPVPLYLAGARLTGLFPLGPIYDGVGLNITVLSQEDRIGFGVIACRELMPKLWDLVDALPAALSELSAAAAALQKTTPTPTPAPALAGRGRGRATGG